MYSKLYIHLCNNIISSVLLFFILQNKNNNAKHLAVKYLQVVYFFNTLITD